MTTYTVIADSEIDPESPGTTTLFTKLRNNPIAITEGAAGAPKIKPKAFAVQAGYMYLGDESDGALTYAVTANIDSDEKYCSSFTVQSGVTLGVNETSSGFLIVRCTGIATIDGTIDLNGKGRAGGIKKSAGTGTAGVSAGLGGAGGGSVGAISYSGAAGGDGALNSGGGGAGSANNLTSATNATALTAQIESFIERHAGSYVPSGLGGAGGAAGASEASSYGGNGGNGGGLVLIIADEIDFTGIINVNGGNGGNSAHSSSGSGGGGGGGVVVMVARNFINNTGTINANGGSGGTYGSYSGGNGADGHYIAITVG